MTTPICYCRKNPCECDAEPTIKAGDEVWTAPTLSAAPSPGFPGCGESAVANRRPGVDGTVQHVDEAHGIALVLHHLIPATVGIYHLHELSPTVASQGPADAH